jgi:hypothetical protein
MIFSAKRARDFGGSSKTSFSKARIVMALIKQKSAGSQMRINCTARPASSKKFSCH